MKIIGTPVRVMLKNSNRIWEKKMKQKYQDSNYEKLPIFNNYHKNHNMMNIY